MNGRSQEQARSLVIDFCTTQNPEKLLVLTNEDAPLVKEALQNQGTIIRWVDVGASTNALSALVAVCGRKFDAAISLQPYRKMKILLALARANRRYFFRRHSLEATSRAELLLSLTPHFFGLHRNREFASLSKLRPKRPVSANDFSTIRESAESLEANWAQLTASVVVPVYNRRHALEKTLAALTLQDYPSALFEVIVADDGSADHPEELRETFPSLSLRFLRQEDKGYRLAEARNLAIRSSSRDIIVSLDCDMIPEPRFLSTHMKWFHATQKPIFVTGYRSFIDADDLKADDVLRNFDLVRGKEKDLAPAAIRAHDRPTEDWRERTFAETDGLRLHNEPSRFAIGGNAAFRREDALRAGLYSPVYQKWGGEDYDFAYQMERMGTYFIAEKGALAYHQNHECSVDREEDRKTTERIMQNRIPRERFAKFPASTRFDVPFASVLVLSTNTKEDIHRTLQSLAAQTNQDFEVLTDEVEVSAQVQTVAVSGSLGARARALFQAANGDCVLFLFAGDVLAPYALARMGEPLKQDAQLGIVFAGASFENDPPRRALPKWYTFSRHLSGAFLGCPALIRYRDLSRVGGPSPMRSEDALFDVSLKVSEQAPGAAVPIEALKTQAPLVAAPEDAIGAALDRTRLPLEWTGKKLRAQNPRAGLALVIERFLSIAS